MDIARTPENPEDAAAYMGPTLELYHQGLTTDAAFELMSRAFVADDGGPGTSKES